jgi:hypothetical protein
MELMCFRISATAKYLSPKKRTMTSTEQEREYEERGAGTEIERILR